MKITILGSGTGIPSLQRCAAGYLLQTETGEHFLIDCGTGILRQLEQVQVGFARLDGLFVTHTHSDHIGDLTALVHAFRLPGLPRQKPFYIFGPAGFIDFFDRIVRPVAEPPSHFPFHILEARPSWEFQRMTVSTTATVHSDRFNSLAYRFDRDGKSIVFSGDCDVDARIVHLSHQADLLICDCSTLAEQKIPGHLCAAEAGQIASQAQVKHLVPTHFYPIAGPDHLRADECAQHYSGPITLAEDFLQLTLSNDSATG
ncbi:MAG: MBL fold metallo-hydrolase [Magnetococcales bacterium]|nr:MBL fold metallo-hydrolase [Magnetococcales bacterium]